MRKLYTFLLLAFPILAISQNSEPIIKKNNYGRIVSVDFSKGDGQSFLKEPSACFKDLLEINDSDDFRLEKTRASINGICFERYQQYYHGIKVEGGYYSFRLQGGLIKAIRGKLRLC